MVRPLPLLALLVLFLSFGCTGDDAAAPERTETYTFLRNGISTVAFPGQTTRIAMATELTAALGQPERSGAELRSMFRNAGPNGEEVAPFDDPALNASTKSVRSKVAASRDYFFTNATTTAAVRSDFDGWLDRQVSEVFPHWNELAAPGQAGQIADGTAARYVDGRGLELDQVFAKGLIGALMLDQIANNYLSPAVLDEADNRTTNAAGTPATGEVYTTMEHKWDEAYGYLFGASPDPAEPLTALGADGFLNKYLGRVDDDPDYTGIAAEIYRAFRDGRAAIVAGDYAARDRQAAEIQERLSRVIAVRAVHYLLSGAAALEGSPTDRGAAFHDLSEGLGFVYSLQFTRVPATGRPYYDHDGVRVLFERLLGGENGLWTVDPALLRTTASEIAGRAGIVPAEAAN